MRKEERGREEGEIYDNVTSLRGKGEESAKRIISLAPMRQ